VTEALNVLKKKQDPKKSGGKLSPKRSLKGFKKRSRDPKKSGAKLSHKQSLKGFKKKETRPQEIRG
jgi:hypothetical protein